MASSGLSKAQMTLSSGYSVTFTPASMTEDEKEFFREIAFEGCKKMCDGRNSIIGEVELRSMLWGADSNPAPELVRKTDYEMDSSGRDLVQASESSIVEDDAGLSIYDAEADQMSIFEAERASVVNKKTGNYDEEESMTEDVEGETAVYLGHKGTQYLAPELIKELQIKASMLKPTFYGPRWRKNVKPVPKGDIEVAIEEGESKTTSRKAKDRPKVECPFEGCNSVYKDLRHAFRSHLLVHYPQAYFCPVCSKRFTREDGLKCHHRSSMNSLCLEILKENRFPTAVCPDGKVKIALKYMWFNIYFLGVMEDATMPDDHFELIAGRKRGDLTY